MSDVMKRINAVSKEAMMDCGAYEDMLNVTEWAMRLYGANEHMNELASVEAAKLAANIPMDFKAIDAAKSDIKRAHSELMNACRDFNDE